MVWSNSTPTLLTVLLNLDLAGIRTVGDLPHGLPPFAVAGTIADKEKYRIDPNRELLGLGFANLATALFSGYPVTGGFSRTAFNHRAGGAPMGETRNHFLSRYVLTVLSMLLCLFATSQNSHAVTCSPTPWDEIGPFYRPNAPERTSIGKGYLLSGTVRSAGDCRPLNNVRIEIWQAGPDGTYNDAHRATLFSDHAGRYRLQTNAPPPYGRRPPHIHILVDAKGFEGLITQHYPKKGKKGATFDLVLEPEKPDGQKMRNPYGN